MVDVQMEVGEEIPLVVEAKGAPWEEGACLASARVEVVMWVEWEGVLKLVQRKVEQG